MNGRPAEFVATPRELQLFSEYVHGTVQAGLVSETSPPLPDWDIHHGIGRNTIRLGEVSDLGNGVFPRNQSADMTLDEFHLWKIHTQFEIADGEAEMGNAALIADEVIQLRKKVVTQWAAGRYYRPKDDAVFTSAPIYMGAGIRRLTPPAPTPVPTRHSRDVDTSKSAELDRLSETRTPTGPGESAEPKRVPEKMTQTGPAISAPAPSHRTRLLGFSWTWIPEETSRKDGKAISLDYRSLKPGEHGSNEDFAPGDAREIEDDPETPGTDDQGFKGAGSLDLAPFQSPFHWNKDLEKMTPRSLKQELPQCTVVLRILSKSGATRRTLNGDSIRGFWDAGFSAPKDPHTRRPYELTDDESLQYEVRFTIDGLKSDSILLGTPVFDDITFYFGLDEVEVLSLSSADTRE